jgi:hypothetical protein
MAKRTGGSQCDKILPNVSANTFIKLLNVGYGKAEDSAVDMGLSIFLMENKWSPIGSIG